MTAKNKLIRGSLYISSNNYTLTLVLMPDCGGILFVRVCWKTLSSTYWAHNESVYDVFDLELGIKSNKRALAALSDK
jgi:hypothetical protein